jgi:hypothetical protein
MVQSVQKHICTFIRNNISYVLEVQIKVNVTAAGIQ